MIRGGWTRGPRGFTLVEVLVALSLISLILALLFGGLRMGSRSWDAREARSAELGEVRVVQGLLRRLLERAAPVALTGHLTREVLFEGESGGMRFVSVMPPHMGVGGYYEIELELESHVSGNRLVMRRMLLHDDLREEDDPAVAGEVVLAEEVREAEFGYFGAARSGTRSRWRANWDADKRLPEMVRIRVTPRNSEAWPELVAGLRASSADAGSGQRNRAR